MLREAARKSLPILCLCSQNIPILMLQLDSKRDRETERGTDRYRQIQWDMPNHIEVQWTDDHDRGEPFRPATPPSWWCVCLPIIFPFNYRGQIISPEPCCPDWIPRCYSDWVDSVPRSVGVSVSVCSTEGTVSCDEQVFDFQCNLRLLN